MKTSTTIIAGVACSALTLTSQASGFRLPESSVTGMSSANAVVADTTTAGAAHYNPATIAFHETVMEIDMVGVRPNLSVTTSSGRHDSQTDQWHILPAFYWAKRVAPDISLGIGMHSPFGLDTEWLAGAFPSFAGPLAGGHPRLSQLKMANISPNLAYKISPSTSIAVGLNYYRLTRLAFDTAATTITGDGDGYGYNLGAIQKFGSLTFGLSYRSQVDADVSGSIVSSSGSTAGNLTLNMPWTAQIGARWDATEAVAIEFDIDRTGWSRFDTLNINNTNGTTLVRSVNGWKDTNAYRLGASFKISPKTTVRAGYTLDKNGQPDAHFSPRLADSDRQLFALGFERDMGGWNLSAGYMHVAFKDRNVSNSAAFNPLVALPDPNGTQAYNGRYQSHAHLLGIGFNVRR